MAAAPTTVSGKQTIWIDGLPYGSIQVGTVYANTETYWLDGLPIQAVWPSPVASEPIISIVC
jgi:hypothetical protein